MDTIVWGPFLAAAVLVGVSPGASNVTAFTNGARGGFVRGFIALCGRLLAFSILLLAVSLGMGALLSQSQLIFDLLKWAGVAYLSWLAWQLWNCSEIPGNTAEQAGTQNVRSLLIREFFVAITNPKAILVFVVFVPQFVTDTHWAVRQLQVLTTVYIAIEFAAASGYVFAGSRLRALNLTPAGFRSVNNCTAILMLAAAIWLILSRR